MSKVPKMVNFNFAEEESELPDINIDMEDLSPEDQDILSSEEKEIIKFEEKEKINCDEIFDCVAGGPKGTAVIKENKEDILLKEPIKENIKPKVCVAKEPIKDKPKKTRKPLSDAHKAKLAISRAKALEARRAKAAERRQMKQLEIEEKELLKTQKIKKVQKLKEEVSDAAAPLSKEEKRVGVVVPDNGFLTKKDLEQAQLDTLMKYESLRKARKEEKKKNQLIEDEKNKMLNTINRAVGTYRYRDGSNIWDRCY